MATERVDISAPSRFGATGTGAVVAIAALGGAMPSLQPLLLAGFAQSGRLTIAEIGLVATAEALGMAVSVGLASVLLDPHGLRAKAAGMLLAAGLLNLLMTQASGLPTILMLRIGAGFCSGLMLWLLIGLLTRCALPVRVTGFYVVGQGVGAFLLSALFSSVALPRWGAAGAYALLGGIGLAAALIASLVPAQYERLAAASGPVLPDRAGGIGLAAALAHLAGIMALWVYVVPVGVAAGFAPDAVRLAISIAIGAQVLAGIGAIRFATLPALPTIAACIAGSLGGIGLVATAVTPAMLLIGLVLFSVSWAFVLPYHVPFLIELDPSRRSVMLLTCVQLLGIAAGPLLAACVIGGGSVRPALATSAALFGGALLLALLAHRTAARGRAG